MHSFEAFSIVLNYFVSKNSIKKNYIRKYVGQFRELHTIFFIVKNSSSSKHINWHFMELYLNRLWFIFVGGRQFYSLWPHYNNLIIDYINAEQHRAMEGGEISTKIGPGTVSCRDNSKHHTILYNRKKSVFESRIHRKTNDIHLIKMWCFLWQIFNFPLWFAFSFPNSRF